ncbi:TY-Chap domain-containing protein [Nocardia salmonicida]|uniref:TY-Chap domain-containing protein n=1 Tax=Nocardia salmonicida TaxID=53431 RepID=UPI0007C86173|nr:hypothetical protein [Nocardia salmonicida]
MTGWATLADALAAELADLPAGAIVKIIEARPGRTARFAQFLQLDTVLSAELVDDDILEAPLRAGDAGQAAIRALGWHERDRLHEHWWAELPWPATSADYHRLADMVVRGFGDGFGLPGPESFVYDAWNERAGNRPIELPLLGLRQKG